MEQIIDITIADRHFPDGATPLSIECLHYYDLTDAANLHLGQTLSIQNH